MIELKDVHAGDRVTHGIFGKGKVIGRNALRGSITIRFDDHGTKELMWAFAGSKTTITERKA